MVSFTLCGHGHKGSDRVVRGGSWNNDARNVRCAARNAIHPADRNDNVGFRLARAQPRVGRPASDPTIAPSAPIWERQTSGERRCASRRQKPFRKLTGVSFFSSRSQ